MTQSLLLDVLGAEDEREFEQKWAAALQQQPPAHHDPSDRHVKINRVPSGRERSQQGAEADPIEHSSRGQCEPTVTRTHVANALSKSLSSKLYGAHHLRQNAAIAARRQRDLDAANVTAAQFLANQKELAKRSAALRREMVTVQANEDAALVTLENEAGQLDAGLDHVQEMASGLTHLLQSQSAKLHNASDSVADAEASRPQPPLDDGDLIQGDSTLPGPVQIAGSPAAWSVQLAVKDIVDAIAEEEETQRADARYTRGQVWMQEAKLRLAQLQEQLKDERHKPRRHLNYEKCARLRNDIVDLRRQLVHHQRCSNLGHVRMLEKIGAQEEEVEDTSRHYPQRRLVALLDGSFGLPVDDAVTIDALTPFDEIHQVPNPFNEAKVAVRSGPNVQHLLFGETYSAGWEFVKGMVWGLIEKAIEEAPVHKPPQSVIPAIWEWRDNAGRRAWHQFDSGLTQKLEERYVRLGKERSTSKQDTNSEAGVAEVRWGEHAEDGGSAAFVIDLDRMVQYPDRDIAMDDATGDAVDGLPCATLVKELVAPQPTLTSDIDHDRQRVLHPVVSGIVREIRRRDPATGAKQEVRHNSSRAVRSRSNLHGSASSTASAKRPDARSAGAIEQAAITAMMKEAEKLARRDKALPVGTRLWVEGIGYGWYEKFERNPRWSGARRQGPAKHSIRVFPAGGDRASRLYEIHLVGPDAPVWSIEPPLLGDDRASRGQTGRLDSSVLSSRKWHTHKTVMGMEYTRYEFTRYQSRQEQVGKREINREPRFWMDTTAYEPAEELPEVAAGGGESAEGE